ncbi:hypothetical protein KC19_3G127500 [Ceratodon purpureus]|uniref:Secreted protein n=1 Tax=Ceratodon purpureus TaxID=3225 RepID=A0A8T0IJW6_CERPU|nr:hypothetical protein KC19_3G127500 [Ceratodon purpureus]
MSQRVIITGACFFAAPALELSVCTTGFDVSHLISFSLFTSTGMRPFVLTWRHCRSCEGQGLGLQGGQAAMDAASGFKFQALLSCRICKVTYLSEPRLEPVLLSPTVAERVEVAHHGFMWFWRLRSELHEVSCTKTEHPRQLHREALYSRKAWQSS